METNNYTTIPDEFELLEFFESEPTEASSIDGFWCYERDDGKGRLLRISFNILEKSIQTILCIDGNEIETVSHEGAKKIYIAEEKGVKILRCECECLPIKTILEVVFEPNLHLKWQSLIDRI